MSRVYNLYKKITNKKDETTPNQQKLAMPRVMTLMQKCVDNKIQDCFIKQLHFNDLLVMIMSIDIANIKQAINQFKMQKSRNSNTEVRDISQHEAIKFLKGG